MTGIVVFIPLTQGKVTVVDFEDYETIREGNWIAERHGKRWVVVGTNGEFRDKLLHRFLFPGSLPNQIDHRDRDSLNNRRLNLRAASPSQNQSNQTKQEKPCSSRFKGVSLHREKSKWLAQITVDKKRKYLGYFREEEAAARAYDSAALKLFGEFACLNFPESTE